MNENPFLSFMMGLFSGVVVGAAVVILVAPGSGLETRQAITGKVQEIMDAGRQAASQRRQELETEYKARIQIPLPASK
jgi:gas vesicle protein